MEANDYLTSYHTPRSFTNESACRQRLSILATESILPFVFPFLPLYSSGNAFNRRLQEPQSIVSKIHVVSINEFDVVTHISTVYANFHKGNIGRIRDLSGIYVSESDLFEDP